VTGDACGRRICLPCIDSTNNWMKQRVHTLEHGTVCYTVNQTAGRGRLGRRWTAADGKSLAMSMLLLPECDVAVLPAVSAVFGLAATEVLREITGLDLKIKWPNDIVCAVDDNRAKICGILCDLCLDPVAIIAGIGINLYQTKADFAGDDLPYAGSLTSLGVNVPSVDTLTAKIQTGFLPLYDKFICGGFSPLRSRYEILCDTIGKNVRVHAPVGGAYTEGTAIGIDDNGHLIVSGPDGVRAVDSGEVTLSPPDNSQYRGSGCG